MTADARQDEKFAATALSLGLVTESQMQEGIKIQKNMETMGIKETLPNVLLKKGFLNQAQIAQILRTMGVQVQPIPGYTILSRLGQGGMGTVYKAKQLSMDRIVALKVLSAQATGGKDFVDRFFREAQAAARLNHKNIISAYDAGCANGIYYFVMEYVEGSTVKHLVDKEGKVDERRALNVILQAAEALQYLHENQMIHRDIKPENIMLDKEGNAKLCDFGLAKQVTGDQGVTKAGFTFGTPYYMSPEQINGRKDLDIRADLYSLGASFFHILTGRVVFDGKDLREVLTRHLTEPAPSPSTIVPTVSERTCKIVLKTLEKDRKHRYQTPAQLVEDLNQILKGAEPIHARRLRRQRSSPWPAIAAVALLALGVGGGVWYTTTPTVKPKRENPPPVAVDKPKPENPGPVETPAPVARDPQDEKAEQLLADAKKMQAEGKYPDAKSIYLALHQTYFTTKTYTDNSEDIWKRTKQCDDAISAVAASQKNQETARVKELQARRVEATNAYFQKKWDEASRLFDTLLLESDLPEGFDRPEMVSMRDRAKRELRVKDEWARIDTLARSGQWAKFLTDLGFFEQEYGRTDGIILYQFEIAKHKVTATKELAAEKAIQELDMMAGERKFDEVRARAQALQREHGDTQAFQKARARLESYMAVKPETPAPVEAKKPENPPDAPPTPAPSREAEAKKALEAANALYKEKKFGEAREAYEKFLNDFEGTDTAKAAAGDIEKALSLDKRKAADEMIKAARAHYYDKKWKEAAELLETLINDYKEVKSVSSSRELPKMLETCKKRIAFTELEVFDTFESGKTDGWWDNDPANREISDIAKFGDGSLRVAFGKHERAPSEGNWPRVLRKVERELPPETSMITFWARVERKDINAKMWVEIRMGEGKSVAVYGVEKLITPQWQQFRIYLTEFKLIWGGEDLQKTKAKPPLDITKVKAIGFAEVNPMGDIAFLIDDMKFEFYFER